VRWSALNLWGGLWGLESHIASLTPQLPKMMVNVREWQGMAHKLNKLTDRGVKTLGAGKHADGGGLYLVVDASGSRRWVFLYTFGGKRREMGLGGVLAVSLASARQEAARLRVMVQSGQDPIEAKRALIEAEKRISALG